MKNIQNDLDLENSHVQFYWLVLYQVSVLCISVMHTASGLMYEHEHYKHIKK